MFTCDEEEETWNHVFFKCIVAWRIWYMCRQWIWESMVHHWEARAHFMLFMLSWATQYKQIVRMYVDRSSRENLETKKSNYF